MSVPNVPRLRRGPRPGAEPADVLAVARRRFLAQQSFDVTAIAAEAGVGRTTMWRWFGDRDALLGELLGQLATDAASRAARPTRKRGAERYLAGVERFLRGAASAEPLLLVLREDPAGTAAVIMAPQGRVFPRLVEAAEALIRDCVDQDGFAPLLAPAQLADLTVEIGMVHLWANVAAGRPPDVERALASVRALATIEPTRS